VLYPVDAVDALIRSQLIHLFDYDKYLAASLETATNPAVINFAMILAKIYLIDDRYCTYRHHGISKGIVKCEMS
jgi:hypothetical protein